MLGLIAYLIEWPGKRKGRIFLCFVGFGVSLVWLLTIVNEVVGVLQVSQQI